MAETFTREVVVRPAYDRRHPNPSKNYGVHGCDLCFYLRGPLGAVHFVVFTGWHLPHVQAEMEAKSIATGPMPADLGYHSPHPLYEGQTVSQEECEFIGGPCYSDGSGLAAEERVWPILLREGSEGLWRTLEAEYRARFEEADRG